MREMKESGIDWIGKIPNNWSCKRLKQILVERNEKNNPIKSENLLSLSIERGVFPYSEKTGGGNKAKENFEDYKLAYENDIVLNSMNVVVGAVGLSKYFGCISPAYYALYCRNNNYNINYYSNLFQSSAFQKSLWGLGNGILVKESDNGKLNTIRMKIPMDKLNNVILPIPPKEEQEKIAKLLDKKITEIDNAIEKTKETIGDYKKYKQSLITKIVTKGLVKNNKNRDVFADNLKELPFDWRYMPLKYFVKLNANSLSDSTDENYKFKYVEIGAVSLSDGIMEYQEYIFKNSPSRARRVVKEGDIIVSTVRTYLKAIAIIKDARDVIVSTGFAVLEPMNINKDYLGWVIKSDYFTDIVSAKSNGISYPAINASDLINIKIPVPSIKEQTQIANKLNNVCKKIDKLIYDKEKIIEELEEYKKSLIYEYVTGKKEVV